MSMELPQLIQQASELLVSGQHAAGTELITRIQLYPSDQLGASCIQILSAPLQDHSTANLQFYTCRILRSCLVRDWVTYWAPGAAVLLMQQLQQYTVLNQHVLVEVPTNKALLGEVAALWAIFWKLRSWTPSGVDVMPVLEWLRTQLELSHEAAESGKVVGRVFITQCVEEFGLYHAAAHARGLAFSAHEQCRSAFCEHALLPLFHTMFQDGLAMDRETPRSATALVQAWLALLSWNFAGASATLRGPDETPESLPCTGEAWMQLFCAGCSTDGAVRTPLELILQQWYNGFLSGGNDRAAQQVLQCFVQCCSVVAEWPVENDIKASRIQRLVHIAMQIGASQLDKDLHAVLSCTIALHRLAVSTDCLQGMFLCPDFPSTVAGPLVSFTQRLIEMAHDPAHADDEEAIESLDYLLKTWLEMICKGFSDVTARVQIEGTPIGLSLADGASTVLKVFLQNKLAAKCGEAGSSETQHSAEYAESQTQLLALLGREHPPSTAPFLLHCLRASGDELLRCVTARQACSEETSESVWFLLTVTAHFLADGSLSERNGIPQSIVSTTLKWVNAFPDDLARQEASNEVFSLMRYVLQFTAALIPHISTGLVSPGVCQSLCLVMKHYGCAYLFPDEYLLEDAAEVFLAAFDKGVSFASCSLQLVATALSAFPHDKDTLSACVDVLAALSDKPPEFGSWLFQQEPKLCQYFIRLASGAQRSAMLEGKYKGHVFSFLVSVCPLEMLSSAVLEPVYVELQTVLQRGQANSGSVDIANVGNAVDALRGAFTALRNEEQTQLVYQAMCPLVRFATASLAHHGSHKPLLHSVLNLLHAIVESCTFLAPSNFLDVVEQGLTTVQVTRDVLLASKQQASRLSKEEASAEEDERAEVLISCANFVLAVSTWGLMDLSSDADHLMSRADGVAELAVQGLLVVLRHMDETMLALPKVRDAVFELLKSVSSTFTGRFLSVSEEDANCLLTATQYGLQSPVSDLNCSALRVMESIAVYSLKQQACPPLLAQFTNAIVQLIVSGQYASSIGDSLGNALFALVAAIGLENAAGILQSAVQQNPLVERPLLMLLELLRATNLLSAKPDVRRRFARSLEEVLVVVKGTRIV